MPVTFCEYIMYTRFKKEQAWPLCYSRDNLKLGSMFTVSKTQVTFHDINSDSNLDVLQPLVKWKHKLLKL
jgi:hypothetical protein